jgi:hypothetical protein
MAARYRLGGMIAFSTLQAPLAQAQASDTLSLRVPPMSWVADSATERMPASHRSTAKDVDRPVRVTYCPVPSYPSALAGRRLHDRCQRTNARRHYAINHHPASEETAVAPAGHTHDCDTFSAKSVGNCAHFRSPAP